MTELWELSSFAGNKIITTHAQQQVKCKRLRMRMLKASVNCLQKDFHKCGGPKIAMQFPGGWLSVGMFQKWGTNKSEALHGFVSASCRECTVRKGYFQGMNQCLPAWQFCLLKTLYSAITWEAWGFVLQLQIFFSTSFWTNTAVSSEADREKLVKKWGI